MKGNNQPIDCGINSNIKISKSPGQGHLLFDNSHGTGMTCINNPYQVDSRWFAF